MAHVRTEAHLDAWIERIFALWSDIHRWPEWLGTVDEILEVSGPCDVAGTRYHKMVRMLGRRMETWGEVVEVDRPRLYKVTERGAGFDTLTVVFRATPAAGGIDVTIETDYTLRGGIAGRIVDALLFRRMFERAIRQSEAKFSALLGVTAEAPSRLDLGRSHIGMKTRLEAPVEQVFALCSDLGRYPEWSVTCERIDQLSGSGDVAGTTYQRIDRLFGLRMESRGEIVAVERPQRLAIAEHAVGITETLVFRLIPAGSGTDLAVEIGYTLPGGVVGRVADALVLRRLLVRNARRNLRNLRALVQATGSPSG